MLLYVGHANFPFAFRAFSVFFFFCAWTYFCAKLRCLSVALREMDFRLLSRFLTTSAHNVRPVFIGTNFSWKRFPFSLPFLFFMFITNERMKWAKKNPFVVQQFVQDSRIRLAEIRFMVFLCCSAIYFPTHFIRTELKNFSLNFLYCSSDMRALSFVFYDEFFLLFEFSFLTIFCLLGPSLSVFSNE